MKRRFFSVISLFFLLFICTLCINTSAYSQTQWQSLAPGLSYTSLVVDPNKSRGKIHAFKIDLNHYHLDLVFAENQGRQAASVATLARHHGALIAINGGFFTPARKPIGLRIQNGEVLYPMQPTSWWGVFMLASGKPSIVSQSAFKMRNNIELALQAGPRLVVNGNIPKLKDGLAERSAICITKENEIIIAATEGLQMSTTDFAKQLRTSTHHNGLGCQNALNLDGGASTQLYAKVGDFSISTFGLSAITDALIVRES